MEFIIESMVETTMPEAKTIKSLEKKIGYMEFKMMFGVKEIELKVEVILLMENIMMLKEEKMMYTEFEMMFGV